MQITQLFKKSLLLNLLNVVSKITHLFFFIYVSSKVSLNDFGVYGYINLATQYFFLFSVIITSSVIREVPIDDEIDYQISDGKLSWSIFIDTLFFIIPIGLCIVFYLFSVGGNESYLFLIVGFFIIFQKFNQIWSSIAIIRSSLDFLFKSRLVQLISFSLGFLIAMQFNLLLALVVYPYIGYLASWLYLFLKRLFSFSLKNPFPDKQRIVKAGIQLQFLTITYWAFTLSDRTLVALIFDTELLGIYTLISTLVLFSRQAIGEFLNLLQPYILKEIELRENIDKKLETITYLIALASILVVFALQISFYFLTKYYAIQYFNYVDALNILSYSLFFIAISGISGTILTSKTLPKIHVSIYLSLLGIIINVVLIFIFVKYNYGLHGAALSSVISISIIGFIQFWFSKTLIFKSKSELNNLLVFAFFPPFIILAVQQIFFNSNVYFSIAVFVFFTIVCLYLILNKAFIKKLLKK